MLSNFNWIKVWALVGLSLTSCSFQSKNELKNTLHLVATEKIKGLDPIYAEELYSGIQVGQAYETLLQYHYLKRPYVLVPNLVEEMPEVSQDGLVYLFHLKKGIKFQNDPAFQATRGQGRELVADDVVYSFKRLADPKLASSGWWILDGKVQGLNGWRERAFRAEKTDYLAEVDGLKAIDRYTLQIKLTQRSAQFLYLITTPFAGIVPREAVEHYGKEFINHPVGTGPFQLSEYNPSARIVWVRNPTYRLEIYPTEGEPGDLEVGLLEDAGKPLPLVDRLIFQVIVEQQPMWLNFMSGKLDFSGIPKDNFASVITAEQELSPELRQKGMRLYKSPAYDVTHETFNMNDPLIGKNKYLRQALSLAYDSSLFIQLFYNGRAVPAQGPLPPGLVGYDAQFRNPYRQFNLVKAKELLAKAGFPDGKNLPALEYAGLANSTGRQDAEFMEKMLAAIGVKLHINTYSWPQFLDVIKNGRAQIWGFAWGADYPDAENFLQLFYSKNVSPGPNDANYMNEAYDRLYEQSLTMSEGKEKVQIYRKMISHLVEDVPWIFVAHRIAYGLVQPWLKNYKANDFDRVRFKYYRVDDNLKGKRDPA